MADVGKSSTGMQANGAALLSYLLGIITGLVFFLVEKENKFVKFHAMQSICFSIALFVISTVLVFIPVIEWILLPLVQLASIVIWVILMVKAFQGVWFKLPIIGKIAAQQIGGIEPPGPQIGGTST